MIYTSDEKKAEYWNHFVGMKAFWPNGFTLKRLEKVRPFIWQDEDFWDDIIWRHGGQDKSPEQMEAKSRDTYIHCIGNMAGMIFQTMRVQKILRF